MNSLWKEAALTELKSSMLWPLKKKGQQLDWFVFFSVFRSYYDLHGFTGQACLLQPQAEQPFPPSPTPSPALPFLWQFPVLVDAREFSHLLKGLVFRKQAWEHIFLKHLTSVNPKCMVPFDRERKHAAWSTRKLQS